MRWASVRSKWGGGLAMLMICRAVYLSSFCTPRRNSWVDLGHPWGALFGSIQGSIPFRFGRSPGASSDDGGRGAPGGSRGVAVPRRYLLYAECQQAGAVRLAGEDLLCVQLL